MFDGGTWLDSSPIEQLDHVFNLVSGISKCECQQPFNIINEDCLMGTDIPVYHWDPQMGQNDTETGGGIIRRSRIQPTAVQLLPRLCKSVDPQKSWPNFVQIFLAVVKVHLPCTLSLSQNPLSCSLFFEQGVLRNGDRPRRSEDVSLWRPRSPRIISDLFLSLPSSREVRLSSTSRFRAARSERKRCRRTSEISFLIFSLFIFSLIAGPP